MGKRSWKIENLGVAKVREQLGGKQPGVLRLDPHNLPQPTSSFSFQYIASTWSTGIIKVIRNLPEMDL